MKVNLIPCNCVVSHVKSINLQQFYLVLLATMLITLFAIDELKLLCGFSENEDAYRGGFLDIFKIQVSHSQVKGGKSAQKCPSDVGLYFVDFG